MSKEQLDNLLAHLDDVDLDLMLESDIEAEAEDESEGGDIPESTPKLDFNYAGYMELEGANKDGDCKIVQVDGGISKDLGCCNLYHPVDGAKKFDCGNCKYED